ncbi:hypothetical protein [Thioalkalivibrio sp.]|uniref:non-homologous end-joining DNA ligase LigD n=1 Tax=Thioalkalivibrio sp. TaxID=2093813 RepID=UPI0012D6729E|nr:hypothetical protein [Thioalkalivibrio sp.]TVP83127.1 MAG: hypothetical protein EA346_00995 [Thioalkalivibrio sp.]
MVDYYRRIAETLLPHLDGRPVSLQRCPDGIDRWTLGNIFRRLAQREDPFKAIGQRGIAIDPERLDRL